MHRLWSDRQLRRAAFSTLVAIPLGLHFHASFCQADSASERQLIARLCASGSDEDRLRSIDAVILSQESGLQLRSALRKMSINDPSPEVRGAARFALVKLQAMAPPTVQQVDCECEAAPPAAALRTWKPKESVEQINEPVVDPAVVTTKGPLTKLGEQLGIRRAVQEIPDVAVVEMKPIDAARITAVATPGTTPISEEAAIKMAAIPIPTASPRTLPPMDRPAPKIDPQTQGVLANLHQKLQNAAVSPALQPLAASASKDDSKDDSTPKPTEQQEGSVPVPTIMQAQQEVVATPAIRPMAEPAKQLQEARLSTIPWPKVPPQATASSSPSDPKAPAIAFGSIPQPQPLATAASGVSKTPASPAPVASQAAGQATPPSPPAPSAAAITAVKAPPTASTSPTRSTSLKPAASATTPPKTSAEPPTQMTARADGLPPASALTNKDVVFVPRTKAQIELQEIPQGVAGRQQMAKELLERGRQLARSGQWSEAESVLFRVRELAVEYRRFSYSPDDLEREIIAARQKERLAQNNAG